MHPREAERELRVAAGSIVAYRLFDIAYAIDLSALETLWTERAPSGSTRARLSATPPEAVSFGVPPVELPLDPVSLPLATASLHAEVTARFYDFGVVTFAVKVPAGDLAWADYAERMNEMDRSLRDEGAGADLWGRLLEDVRRRFAPALVRPAESAVEEDYLIGIVSSFDEKLTAEALRSRIDLAPLLSGESRALSEGARADLLRQRFSYYADDLAVLTWDRAFIYEPRQDSDVADVLEVANAQLVEMRYYDELLDAELPRMYDLIERTQRTTRLLASRRFADLARRLSGLVAEVTELTEKVDNALKVTEDVYLARVYEAALDLFRVSIFGAAVDRKLAIIRDTYAALYQEASAARAALMEGIIVVLILIEIVVALARL
ncbi:MAG TPA: hypothetical protein VMF62_14080 [Acetobacteraceae bacterium]|jgi:hypothetical protein|nr:hypothetical protein [Acetobacteraceae bacterium]